MAPAVLPILSNTGMDFPQYRKLSGGLKYYHILSATEWEEAYLLGNKLVKKKHIATQLPERNFLMDLLEFREGNVVEISEKEYALFTNGIL